MRTPPLRRLRAGVIGGLLVVSGLVFLLGGRGTQKEPEARRPSETRRAARAQRVVGATPSHPDATQPTTVRIKQEALQPGTVSQF